MNFLDKLYVILMNLLIEGFIDLIYTFILFSQSFLAVDLMRNGAQPTVACKTAISRIKKYHPDFFGAIICANTTGGYGEEMLISDVFPKTFCVLILNMNNNKGIFYQNFCPKVLLVTSVLGLASSPSWWLTHRQTNLRCRRWTAFEL